MGSSIIQQLDLQHMMMCAVASVQEEQLQTLLVTGLQGRKCRLGILRKIESTADTLQESSKALPPNFTYKYLHI